MTGLSRMRGNSHVRFLGGDGSATSCSYPTAGDPQGRGFPDRAGGGGF